MPANTNKRRQLEPISYDELLSNAGMSGFVSFLEPAPATESAAALLPLPAKPNRRPARVRKANVMEDGHSLAEQAVYEALWKAGVSENGAEESDRIIRIGYHRLAQITRLSWVSVKANLRSLEKKLAIDVIGSEISAEQQGKMYRVYSRFVVMERRRRAGLDWVRRTRGVELLARASVADISRGASG
jgi:hypothetical protein